MTQCSAFLSLTQWLELLMKKKRKFLGGGGACPLPQPLPTPPSPGPFPNSPPPTPWEILKVETNIWAIWGILEANSKKSRTWKLIMNISFVPSICIHRSIILIFIEKKVCLSIFPHWKYCFPRFSIFISVRILVSVMNSRLCWQLPFCTRSCSRPKTTNTHTTLDDYDSIPWEVSLAMNDNDDDTVWAAAS